MNHERFQRACLWFIGACFLLITSLDAFVWQDWWRVLGHGLTASLALSLAASR